MRLCTHAHVALSFAPHPPHDLKHGLHRICYCKSMTRGRKADRELIRRSPSLLQKLEQRTMRHISYTREGEEGEGGAGEVEGSVMATREPQNLT